MISIINEPSQHKQNTTNYDQNETEVKPSFNKLLFDTRS